MMTMMGQSNDGSSPPVTPPSGPIGQAETEMERTGSRITTFSDMTIPPTPPSATSKDTFNLPSVSRSVSRTSGPAVASGGGSISTNFATCSSGNQLFQGQEPKSSISSMTYLRVRGSSGKRGSNDSEASSTITGTSSGHGGSSATPRSSFQTDLTDLSTPRSSFQFTDTQQMSSKAGVVITSSRQASRRSSTASAASAFAVATAACSNPPDNIHALLQSRERAAQVAAADSAVSVSCPQSRGTSRLSSATGADLKIPLRGGMLYKRESMINTAATMRVLNVLRHWISKHSQDFEHDPKLMQMTKEFLEELVSNTNLLPAEHKAASQLLQMITKECEEERIDLDLLLSPPSVPSRETIESLSALEIAEGLTYLDHKIFVAIQSVEFLGQAWMKGDKLKKAPNIVHHSKRFNEVTHMVASEVLRFHESNKRVTVIEKWVAVADICRCLHNFNGVLQICSALGTPALFRLKKTWEKVCKTVSSCLIIFLLFLSLLFVPLFILFLSVFLLFSFTFFSHSLLLFQKSPYSENLSSILLPFWFLSSFVPQFFPGQKSFLS